MSKLKGRFISKQQANDEVNLYIKINNETRLPIRNAISKLSNEAKTYYGDNELSFVFERSLVEELFSLNSNNGCNALRVYYAASDKNEPDYEIKRGSTTIVLVAAKVTTNKEGNIIEVLNLGSNVEDKFAIQYPGGTDISYDSISIDLSTDKVNDVRGIANQSDI